MAKERDNQNEERGRQIDVARANLSNEYILGLAASKIGTPADYGKLIEGVYAQTVSNVPDESTYNQLFLPALLNSEQGATVNGPYLKTSAAGIVQESLFILPADEALKLVGVSDEVAGKYADKSVGELSDNEKGAVVSSYFANMVESVIEKRLPEMRKARAGQLEKILSETLEK